MTEVMDLPPIAARLQISELVVTLFIDVVTATVIYLPPIVVGLQMNELGGSQSIYRCGRDISDRSSSYCCWTSNE